MSKMDGLRAMREAKYAAATKRAGAPTTAPRKAAKPAVAAVAPPAAASVTGASDERLCGHRNMSGRSCTREHGHAAKSHRYS